MKPILSLVQSDSWKNVLNDKNRDDFAWGIIFGESIGIFVTQIWEKGMRDFVESEMDEMKIILSKRLVEIKETIFQMN